MNGSVVLVHGDGVGQEVLDQARAVLDQVALDFGHTFSFEETALDRGTAEVVAACRRSTAALWGIGPGEGGAPAQALSDLRRQLTLHTTVRPFRIFPEHLRALPFRPERFRGVDVLVVSDSPEVGQAAPRLALERAFGLASGRWHLVTSVEAAESAQTHSTWRDLAVEVARNARGVRLEHLALEHAVLRLVTSPTQFDVVAAPARFADQLIDQAATLAGSVALLSGAALGDGTFGAYYPLHGAMLHLARRGRVNPVGGILAAALMLRHSLGLEREASAVEAAVAAAIAQGARTADLPSERPFSTREMGEAIRANLATDFSTSRAI
jgi:3-isopropylmalate dehydrogenase